MHNSNLQSELALEHAQNYADSPEHKVTEVDLYLRAVIMQEKNKCNDLPYPLTPEAVSKGQITTPDILLHFFQVLYTGLAITKDSNDRIHRYVESTAADVIFATTRGQAKPGKHLTLGLGVKSMTGSRKLIEILNRMGHSVSYHVVEALETDLAMSVKEKTNTIPDGMILLPGLSTGTAWDNYDELNETLSGKNTLHDTVGICYQNIPEHHPDPNGNILEIGNPECAQRTSQRKRKFDALETPIQPYRKLLRKSKFDYAVKAAHDKPNNLKIAQAKDMAWTVSCALMNDTPMWTGWNSLVSVDVLPRQVIGYMENINLPPTRLDVVAETLKRSQAVAKECGEEFALVTYDLAIAKPALQIQIDKAPNFDNVFICFGAFHIQMAYFGALGHILEESGGPQVLADTEVLAIGSLNGFLSGRHYNRCKRLHVLLATAFRVLHFRSYVATCGNISASLLNLLTGLKDQPSSEAFEVIQNSPDFLSFLENYERFTEETRSGNHGSTAQFWMVYIDLVGLFLLFSRACHSNDLDLYIYSLGEMCSVFFASGRPNYSRWMARYHLNLLNIDETHPGVRQMLENGGLSVKHTKNTFARTPVDQALEQTVNADAASRLTGISAFSQSIGARQRWMVTRAMRSAVVSNLLSISGLKQNDASVQEVKPYRIQRDNSDLEKLITGIESRMNPFVNDVNDEYLYCISSGCAASGAVKIDMTQCFSIGRKWHDEFVKECVKDSSRFERPIQRRKVKNFASDAVKMKVKGKDMKVKEIQASRDLFGRFLFLATENDMDLAKVLTYPLTPIPSCLANLNGMINKTDKSALLRKLESNVSSRPPAKVDACIIDAMLLYKINDGSPCHLW